MRIALCLAVMLVVGTAHAGRKSRINFDEQVVSGKYNKPDIFTSLTQKGLKLDRLIKLRENFIPEMKENYPEISIKK